MTDDIANEVLATLRTIAPEVDPAAVDRRALLTEQLDLDSMDVQRFLAALGARYQVDIPEADLATLGTIDDIVAYLEQHRG
jgi:acyl carrier protein